MRAMAAWWLAAATLFSAPRSVVAATPGPVPGSVSPLVRQATDLGPAPASETHRIVVALALRERDALDAFLRDVHDPDSSSYRRFMTPEEFNARHAPTPEDEQALVTYLERNGLGVSDRFPNRLLADFIHSFFAPALHNTNDFIRL